jgi:hypothetical protein
MNLLRCLVVMVFGFGAAGQAWAIDELAERREISATTQQAFLAADFRKLEELSQAYRTEKSRTSSGLWKLTLFYAGIGDVAIQASKVGEGAFAPLEERTVKWAQQYPNSPTAHIAHSIILLEHGWVIRGTGYADTVKPEAWAPFRRYVALARKNLEEHKSVASGDPRWYETMLVVARAEAWDRKQFDSLLNEALDREPSFYQTYFSALEYLLPKWHGDVLQIERFARDAVKRTAKQEGKGMYARIYWFASQSQFHNDLFTSSLAVWPRMREGFEDVVSKYPDAWNVNNYAKFACLAKDRLKTRELLSRINSNIVPEAWQPAPLFQKCADWAHQLEANET